MTSLTVRLDRVQHTLVYDKLQSTIHLAASYPEELKPDELGQFLALALRYLDEQEATAVMNKTLAYMLLQLALLLGSYLLMAPATVCVFERKFDLSFTIRSDQPM